jgi:vacuolar-type H+-ATPase subunit H
MEEIKLEFTIKATEEMKKFFDEERQKIAEEQQRVYENIEQHVDTFINSIRTEDGSIPSEEAKKTLHDIAMIAASIGWNLCFEYHNNQHLNIN